MLSRHRSDRSWSASARRAAACSSSVDESQTAIGLVAFAYELLDAGDPANEAALRGHLRWLEQNLRVPDRFNRSTSKGWYRRETRGLSWLRASAIEYLDAMRALVAIVEQSGHVVRELRTHRVGYVTYEDEHQVVAEPFRETPTR